MANSFGYKHNSLIQEDMEKLTEFKASIKEKVEGVEREGYKSKPDVLKWLKDVQKPENEHESMQESIATVKNLAYKCCLNHSRGSLYSRTKTCEINFTSLWILERALNPIWW